jgi:predicted NACHT family NTPase
MGKELFAFDLRKYFECVLSRYRRVDIEDLTPPEREEYLQILLSSVFVEQDVKPNPPPLELPKELWQKLRRRREIDAEDVPEGLSKEQLISAMEGYLQMPSRRLFEVVTDGAAKHLAILGDPGAGKSTFLRYLLVALADSGGD